jgi:hypothetical protein
MNAVRKFICEGSGEWPLFAALGPVGALDSVPRVGRSFCAVVLKGWGLAELAADAELVIGELSANVVQAAAGPDGRPRYDAGRLPVLWLRLLSDRVRVRVEVWDDLPLSCGVPVRRQAGEDDESGRGLELVDALTKDWGWETVPSHYAKRVWATLAA